MTRIHALLAVAVAVFVVVAPASAMATPAAAGTQDDGVDDGLAPGVSENGTVNTTALYDAHRSVLSDEGYQTTENLSVELNGSSFLTATTNTTGAAGGENVSQTKNVSVVGIQSDISVWANNSTKVVQIVKDDNVSYAVFERGPPSFAGPPRDDSEDDRPGRYGPRHGDGDGPRHGDGYGPHHGDGYGPADERGQNGPYHDDGARMPGSMGSHHAMMMGMHQGMGPGQMPVPGFAILFLDEVAGNFTVENETTEDNRTLYILSAPVEVDEEARGNFTGTVLLMVDDRGVVHEANVTVDSSEYGLESEYQFTLEELGVDSVTEPGWVDAVPENATRYGPPTERPGGGPPTSDGN